MLLLCRVLFVRPVLSYIIAPDGPSDNTLKAYSTVYLLPARLCVDAVALDFTALCVSPPVEGGGLRSVDHRVEPFLLPTNNVEHSAYILSTFEKKVRLACLLCLWVATLLV